VTIYIILLGIAIIRGAVEYPFREFVYRGIKLAALVYAVTTLYGASVGLLAMNGLPAEVANAVGAQNVTGLGGFFDGILKGAIRAIANIDDIVRAHTVAEGTLLAGIPNNWDEISQQNH
jgi:type IV secretion system protein VirB6